jgi:hypothetical protein
MSETALSSTFSAEIPHPHAWPYLRAYSSVSTVYYQVSEEAHLPVYEERFWSLIGRQIKVLGHVLVENDCSFIPQSEGQFLSRDELKEAWNALKNEEKAIRKSGLMLTNFETGEQIQFKNSDYRVPWHTFEDFESDIKLKLQVGCIYFLVPKKLENISGKMKEKPYITQYTRVELLYDILSASDSEGQEQQFSLFCATVDCPTKTVNADEWLNLTNYVYGLLKGG